MGTDHRRICAVDSFRETADGSRAVVKQKLAEPYVFKSLMLLDVNWFVDSCLCILMVGNDD